MREIELDELVHETQRSLAYNIAYICALNFKSEHLIIKRSIEMSKRIWDAIIKRVTRFVSTECLVTSHAVYSEWFWPLWLTKIDFFVNIMKSIANRNGLVTGVTSRKIHLKLVSCDQVIERVCFGMEIFEFNYYARQQKSLPVNLLMGTFFAFVIS